MPAYEVPSYSSTKSPYLFSIFFRAISRTLLHTSQNPLQRKVQFNTKNQTLLVPTWKEFEKDVVKAIWYTRLEERAFHMEGSLEVLTHIEKTGLS